MKKFVWSFLLLGLLFSSCSQSILEKIDGLSLVATRDSLLKEQIRPVKKVHANYVAIMPFGFVRNLDHPEIIYNTERQWFGETAKGVRQYIRELKKEGIEVMLKPQIWIWRGSFTGHMKMEREEDWLDLENCYRNFILDFAQIAAEEKVALFCIGTELEQFINHRPDYWFELIRDIQKVYSGKLTYAANWDEYKRVPFWEALDFIGVDAYFPIASSKTPSLEESIDGWQQWKDQMQDISESWDRPVLFTEYGYRSVDYAGKEPWVSSRELKEVNLVAQKNLLEALYQEIWMEEWFAGGFLWKWHPPYKKVGGEEDTFFTPQGKPAEKLIRSYYRR